MTKVYLRDMHPDKQTDAFFGKGLEALKEKAEREGKEVIVGEYYDKPVLED